MSKGQYHADDVWGRLNTSVVTCSGCGYTSDHSRNRKDHDRLMLSQSLVGLDRASRDCASVSECASAFGQEAQLLGSFIGRFSSGVYLAAHGIHIRARAGTDISPRPRPPMEHALPTSNE